MTNHEDAGIASLQSMKTVKIGVQDQALTSQMNCQEAQMLKQRGFKDKVEEEIEASGAMVQLVDSDKDDNVTGK